MDRYRLDDVDDDLDDDEGFYDDEDEDDEDAEDDEEDEDEDVEPWQVSIWIRAAKFQSILDFRD